MHLPFCFFVKRFWCLVEPLTPQACENLKSHFTKKSFCLFLLSLIRHMVLTWELLLSFLVIYLAVSHLRCGMWDPLVGTCMLRTPLAQYLWLVGVVASRHAGSFLPDQGSNLHPLHWKVDSYTGKVLLTWKLSIQFKSIILKYIFCCSDFIFLHSSILHQFSSVQFSRSVMSYSLPPHGLQHARPPCPSPTPGVYSNSCPLSQWCHPTISSSVVPFSSCLQSFPASGFFQMSQFFASGGQSKPF